MDTTQSIEENQEEQELKEFDVNADIDILLQRIDRDLIKFFINSSGKQDKF